MPQLLPLPLQLPRVPGVGDRGWQAKLQANESPRGDSSNLFGTPEVIPSNRPNRMASNIFGASGEPQNTPKGSNPPGSKGSGIFEEQIHI
uniref:Jupiter microtubule associated homolog 2 n=1 Tax=Vombatus ursinus TaxID=29139 RepID=A0A4X2JVP7_VOMUR